METIYFALGMGSVIITVFSVVIVLVSLKVNKLNKKYEDLVIQLNHEERNQSYINENIYKHIDENVKMLYDQIHLTNENTTRENKKYVDSRIDKLIDTHFSYLNIEREKMMSNRKQIIKG
jgi:uncharacterized membrane protein YhiD involved in acid resistance